MANYMAKYQRKYITLPDASKISGYTAEELRNFTKIGLIPFKKQKNQLYIRFDAFEKINDSKDATAEKTKPSMDNKSVAQPAIASLVPFTMPHPKMAKVLETAAFTAALAMVLHISMMPNVANKVLQTIDLSERTVAYMGETMSSLLQTGVAAPVEVGTRVAAISTLSASTIVEDTTALPMVAGVSVTETDTDVITVTGAGEGFVTSTLIRIADSADSFSSFLEHLSANTFSLLVSPFQYEKMDSGIQSFFRL